MVSAVTVIIKVGKDTKDAEAGPSLTEILIPGNDPVTAGVPVNAPVKVSKAAHVGLFSIENAKISLSASIATGMKL